MEKILVIDDEPVIRILLKQLFEKKGYEVVEASDGKQGLDLFKKQSPDLVITDLIMPEEEGLSVIRKIKQMDGDAKIIAISGGGIGSADIYLDLAKSMGAAHIFKKPFDVQDVLLTVEQMLADE